MTQPRRRWPAATATLLAVAVTCATGGAARAASSDDDDSLPDPRLSGYQTKVELGGGTAGAFAILAVLGAISIGVMFKNSNRSHLD